ncbi:zinc dependent phospholipase C family protein [Hymenobacter sp. 15J16-1T3B]|uniref:zinc dependent phospholipase C family protein n=1 Tax=Hymenobacter sp. 15J16-1T3B TaxID=2886941 RepID=UPI001D0F5EB8|nr:zinc dependent phospholipase C family protein [Hymenobacter sp. 15J16-1T3B]MCC3158381.1 zinc dependent phospholipase C family protein [Hymenobacter sp. 15J16-1T3B]
MKKALLPLALALLVPVFSPGWGFFGHRTITQVAVYALPSGMQNFYFRHMAQLVKLSTAPDERRTDDPNEEHKHYIDMDHFGDNPFGLMPKAYDKAVAKYTADTLKKYGTVPWTVLEVKEKLTDAFRDGDTTAIIALSADLDHYVADAFVPLHTTENYDGQLTKQQGIHSLWESKLPELFIAQYKLDSEKADYLKDPQAAIWGVIQSSYGFLGATFDIEAELNKKFTTEKKYTFSHKYGKTRRSYSDEFAKEYNKKVGGMVAYRLKGAPTMVASFWYSAWKDAGSPDLNKLMRPSKLSKDEKEQLDTQLKAWKENQLVDQNLLLAMQKEAAGPTNPADIPDETSTPAAPAAPADAPKSAEAKPAEQPAKVKVKEKKEDAPKQKEKTKVKKDDGKKKDEKKSDDPFGD